MQAHSQNVESSDKETAAFCRSRMSPFVLVELEFEFICVPVCDGEFQSETVCMCAAALGRRGRHGREQYSYAVGGFALYVTPAADTSGPRLPLRSICGALWSRRLRR